MRISIYEAELNRRDRQREFNRKLGKACTAFLVLFFASIILGGL